VSEQTVRVECYAGYRGDERPLRLKLSGRPMEIVEIEDRWYSPGATSFRVVVDGGDRYLLRHDDVQDIWSLTGFRAAPRTVRTVTATSERLRMSEKEVGI
jgi:hypothetical protein